MKKLQLLLFVSLLLGLVQFSCNPGKNQKLSDVGLSADTMELATQAMQNYIDEGKLAGIAALVYKDGEVAYRQNFGFADIANRKPIENNTIYRIYSMTKPITAVALMTLFDEGKFQLDDKVAKYIPEFEGAQVYNAETKSLEPQTEELTIRHLLTHTSGIPYGWDQKAYVDSLYRVKSAGSWDGTIGEKVKILAKIPLKSQPGTTYEYGLGIDVAGYLYFKRRKFPQHHYQSTENSRLTNFLNLPCIFGWHH